MENHVKENQNKERSFLAHIIIFLKGMLMGAADIIPGVSGGTIALITGIYSRLIDGINGVFTFLHPKTFKLLFKFKIKTLWRKFLKLDLRLFIPLALGIGTSFIALSNLMHYLMEEQTLRTYSFFFGLILGSAVFLYRHLKQIDAQALVSLGIGAVIGFLLVGMEALKANHSLPIIFGSGAIAITAMILPGISGSFMLVMLNQYEFVINAIRTFNFRVIVTFGIGAFFGMFGFSKLLNYLLHNHKNNTLAFLIGIMLGSLRLQYNIMTENALDSSMMISTVIIAILGYAMVFIIDKLGKGVKHD
jgi:putative membrane protein